MIRVSWEQNWSRKTLASHWQALEAEARPTIFLSWAWWAAWLEESGLTPRPLAVWQDERLIGLSLWFKPASRGWPTPLALHLAGQAEPDSVYIEYNGWLCRAEDHAMVSQAMAQALAHDSWLRLRLPGIDPAEVPLWTACGWRPTLWKQHRAPWIDLAQSRKTEGGYRARLSRNTRQQLHRALRGYAQRGSGEVRLIRPTSSAQALAHFDQMVDWHQHSWQQRGQPGAFAPAFMRAFHRRLIATLWPQGAVDLPLLQAGDHPIGIAYNFLWHGVASSYQSGFCYDADPRLKPGLVTHCLLAEDYLERGLDRYCLLAGASRYKQSLADCADAMVWVDLTQAPRRAALIALAERISGKIRRILPERPPTPS